MTGSLPENALTQQYPTEYVQALRNNQLAAAIDDANLTPDIRADIHAELVRLSFMPTRSESERYAIADRALAQYAALEICGMITQTALPSTSVFRLIILARY